MSTRLIGALIFVAIFLVVLLVCLYFARRQRPKAEHYGTWSNVLGPQFRGEVMDMGEQINARSDSTRRGVQRARRRHHS